MTDRPWLDTVRYVIILVTGATSGFGKLLVPHLLERGHTVVAGIRGGQARLIEIFPELVGLHAGRLLAFDLHLENPESFQTARSLITEKLGARLDVLVNNAGYGLFGPFEDISPEQLRHQLEVNFFGPFGLTRTLLPLLRASRGRIINVSSIVGLLTFPYYGAYCVSKYALEAFSEALYYELKPFGVQVGLIEPGAFATDFNLRGSRFVESVGSSYGRRTEALREFIARSRWRLGNPERVARLLAKRCEQRKIPLRTVVGRDARVMAVLKRILPDSWRVRLEAWIFRCIVFKE